jgi:hypothetical protein
VGIGGEDMSTINYKEWKIVNDFKEFCRFVETEKPVLSQKKGVLGKKDAFNLNSRMHFKREVEAPNYQQEQYFCIDLLFSLAVEGQLFRKVKDEKGKLRLLSTARLDSFMELNDYEQYVFLLETYWCYYDFENKFSSVIWGADLVPLCNLFRIFEYSGAGKRIVKNEEFIERAIGNFYSFDFSVILQLSFFALCSYELNDAMRNPYDDKLKAIVPTPLGITISRLFLQEGLKYRDKKILPPAYRTLDAKNKKSGKRRGLHKVLAGAFPEGAVKKTVDINILQKQKGIYYFKVSLTKTLWRIIKLAYSHTLEDLHLAIQFAFAFDNDHLYAFYLEGEKRGRRMGHGIYCREAGAEGFKAEETLIGECGFYTGQTMTYLFDFGEMWKFDVTLLNIDRQGALPLKPEIVEEKGEPPEQYPDWY